MKYSSASVVYSCQCLVSNKLSLTVASLLSAICLLLTFVNALSSVRLSVTVVNALSEKHVYFTVAIALSVVCLWLIYCRQGFVSNTSVDYTC